ncbi:filamentous hemagglutinin N-terminal domain-containing protein [Aetokthonos hydrillicola Thurmond2011]|jgi:filamentous hemagglutinin family protein|uniref:Filamentous hemagglutinin N-terminal domain-containing protein n=1 Tax=Aetokthonos hydrillicola Thurmond2011 TaxID=2712845 RepID=A0AAP5MAH3_9CYAN|nr:filamentous hemagglutinin N-terminal domain-containing protein [Aetokthonos hydrillicola]MBO3462056.1 filamentous hemagglutinin N-terminal domain-containing protein [Aetokthonos hydrillicola CCALA 1050]MBW4589337.1 filamentous hemagglutinin N-terminal domain-containing protein [Aetokthonos hydrillicola CCALA 1050]MDR9898130.1 filamentous hemagglutinin N-terminal domain-containing protein [Aetokthonos hydrillicola Thurmond2011]
MKQLAWQILVAGSTYLWCLFISSSVQAQITSDNTVSTNVNKTGNVLEITGGRQVGGNLFHSFQEFSVPTGSEAFFKNVTNINTVNNIISRITGGSISNIDGLIKENYGANLILINPSGINFGPNAQLDIGGSFLASTANSLKFADGTVYSAINPQVAPTLTISVPLGLQLGTNSGAIRVQGTGHNLTLDNPLFSPFNRGTTGGLKVQPGHTLALIGSGVTVDGGTLTAEGGRIELGSVGEGLVSLNPIPQGWSFGYQGLSNFQDIALSQKALADTSGLGSGSIQLQGRNISISDGSSVLIQNQGSQAAAGINVNASASLKVSGTTTDGKITSNLFTESLGTGKGGDITISTPNLTVENGAEISASTFSNAPSGNIAVNAPGSVQLTGYSPVNPARFSNIRATTFSSGNAGKLTLSTQRLTATQGGSVGSATGGSGNGGDVTVNASQLVELIGVTPGVLTPSEVTAGTGSSGNAGNVTINTPQLIVRDGGRVDASTLASGRAGNVTINAQDVEVTGNVPGSINPSLIIASGNTVDPSLQQLFRISSLPSGASGNVTINTDQLKVTDGAQITARNDGLGISGNVKINARSIFLDTEGSITADMGGRATGVKFSFFSPVTVGGTKGGDIQISSQQLLVQNGASISTSTFTNARGGDIFINSPQSMQVLGFLPTNPQALSYVGSATYGSGKSGNTNISTGDLIISNGARVGAGTFGSASGGDILVNASNSVQVLGSQPNLFVGSLLGASTFSTGNAGNVTVNTPKLVVRDGGRVDSSTTAVGTAGNVTINAKDSVEVSGVMPITFTPSLISSGATVENPITRQIFNLPDLPSGASGNVTINTNQLKVSNGGQITTSNQGTGNSGNVRITANSIVLDNGGSITSELGGTFRLGQLFFFSPITLGARKEGDITISTQQLVVQGASAISTATYTNATGGNIIINAPKSVQVIGASSFNPNALSFIGSSTTGSGNSGNVSISTGEFSLQNGGLVSASTFGSGTGGNVTINATKSVEVSGTDSSKINSSLITVSTLKSGNGGSLTINSPTVTIQDGGRIDSGANIPDVNTQRIFNLTSQPSGSSGDITINTNQLSVKNGGQVTVNNEGTGNAGILRVTASSISLDNQGSITATTRSGEGGNINLKAQSFLLRHQSQISAQAGGSGNGGNITISGSSSADSVALLEGSKINANAFKGIGGNISISTQGLFVCTADCQITSSSTLGLNGVVKIVSPETRANFEVVDLPQEVAKPEEVVAQACPAQKRQNRSQFLVTGRGGLPPQPNDSLSSEALVSFDSLPSDAEVPSTLATPTENSGSSVLPLPARSWYTNDKGVVILTAKSLTATPYISGLSSPSCHAN